MAEEFRVHIRTDSDAFSERAELEIARILRDLADKLERGAGPGTHTGLQEYNGNLVGSWDAHGSTPWTENTNG